MLKAQKIKCEQEYCFTSPKNSKGIQGKISTTDGPYLSEHSSSQKKETPTTDFATANFGSSNNDLTNDKFISGSLPDKQSIIFVVEDFSPEKPLAEVTVP